MTDADLITKSNSYLRTLCREIPERCVGSEGNRQASRFFKNELESLGWSTEMPEFEAMDWRDGGAVLTAGDSSFRVLVSPYSNSFSGEAELVIASTVPELEAINATGKIILLKGDIAKEQLMPRNFVFYNPEEHQKIIALLDKCGAKALICATDRNAALAGGVYPFPLIEDGDFDIPSVYMTAEEGERLSAVAGQRVSLNSDSARIPGKGYNVIGKKGGNSSRRIVVTAHIDAKKGTPGAIDNATGVIVMLLLAELLKEWSGDLTVELVALNGEDYYAVPGQMNYMSANSNTFNTIILNINIDGAGYKDGPSAFSLFGLPAGIESHVHEIIDNYPGVEEGIQWPQGDHSIFLQQGIPAIAVTSKWFIENMSDQDITHTPRDTPEIVDCNKIAEIAGAINSLIRKL